MSSLSQRIVDFRPTGHSEPMGDFDEWMVSQARGADCIVALAQAAPRLLHVRGLLDRLAPPVICERALAFLPDDQIRGRAFLIFDDTISFGSTMHEVYRRLVDGGASTVKCAALLVDKREFLGERADLPVPTPSPYFDDLRPNYVFAAKASDVSLFHAVENQEFRRIGRPFTYDFPVFQSAIQSEFTRLSPDWVAARLGEQARKPFSWPLVGRVDPAELYSFSIAISSETIAGLFPNLAGQVLWQPFSKLRVYVDARDHMLRFTPMVQIETRGVPEIEALPSGIARAIYGVLSAALAASRADDKHKRIAQHRALAFALACDVGQRAWASWLGPSFEQWASSARPTLSGAETSFLLGPNCAKELDAIVAASWPCSSDGPQWDAAEPHLAKPERFPGAPPDDAFTSKRLWTRMRQAMSSPDADPDWKPQKARKPYENLGYMLSLLFEVIDESARAHSGVERLERGLTFTDLLTLLNSYGARATPMQLSSAIDALLDGGLMVPQLLLDEKTNVVRRGFRSGENQDSDDTVQLKSIITRLLLDRRDSGRPPLTEKGFAKTFVVLKKLFGDRLPFTLGLRTYGLEPFVNDEVLRDWSIDHKITELESGRLDLLDTGRKPRNWVMEAGEKASLRSAFDFVSSLDTAAGPVAGAKMLLLLSTCNNYENTFNACAFEVASWLRRERYNFERVISVLAATDWERVGASADAEVAKAAPDLFAEQSADDVMRVRARVLDSASKGARLSVLLQKCREYLVEFKNKTSVFDEFDTIANGLKTHFSASQQMRIFAEERFSRMGI